MFGKAASGVLEFCWKFLNLVTLLLVWLSGMSSEWGITIDAAAGTRGGVRPPGRLRMQGTARQERARAPATTRAGARPPLRRRLPTLPPGLPPTTTRSTRNRPHRDTPATVTTTHHVTAEFPEHLSYFTTNTNHLRRLKIDATGRTASKLQSLPAFFNNSSHFNRTKYA